jgi:integrase/recombinase XerD
MAQICHVFPGFGNIITTNYMTTFRQQNPRKLTTFNRLQIFQEGSSVAERRLPILSAYLGHVHWSDTFWYLSALPELMHEAMSRLERRWEDRP